MKEGTEEKCIFFSPMQKDLNISLFVFETQTRDIKKKENQL